MYKLTCESEDEQESKIDGPPQQRKSDDYPENYGATSTTSTRTQDKLKIKRDSTKKFYSLFANDAFVQEDTLKKKESCCNIKFIASGFLFFVFCAAAAVFVVLLHRVEANITRLEKRVSDLEGAFLSKKIPAGQNAPEIRPVDISDPKFAFREEDDHQNIFTSSFFEHMDASEKRFKATSAALRQLKENMQIQQHAIDRYKTRIAELGWSLKLATSVANDEGYAIENILDESRDLRFTLWKASPQAEPATNMYKVENTIKFVNILDESGMALEDSFTVLRDGDYMIIFEYCVRPSMKQVTSISVLVNGVTERSVNTPLAESYNELIRYKLVMKLFLIEDDNVSLNVSNGAIIEVENSTSNACTKLTVFKI